MRLKLDARLGHLRRARFIEAGMPGYAHIIRLGTREATYGRTVGQYQFTYNAGGSSWVRTFDDEHSLAEFLRSQVGVVPEIAARALEDLRRAGNATLTGVEIREGDASALGLEELPSDS